MHGGYCTDNYCLCSRWQLMMAQCAITVNLAIGDLPLPPIRCAGWPHWGDRVIPPSHSSQSTLVIPPVRSWLRYPSLPFPFVTVWTSPPSHLSRNAALPRAKTITDSFIPYSHPAASQLLSSSSISARYQHSHTNRMLPDPYQAVVSPTPSSKLSILNIEEGKKRCIFLHEWFRKIECCI